MIKGLLFDKDGTLFDFNLTWGRWARGFIDAYTSDRAKRQELAAAFLFHYDEERFDPNSPIVAGTSHNIYQAIESVFPKDNAADIADKVRFSGQNATLHSVCDLFDYLGALKKEGYFLGIATNDSEAGARRQLGQENVLELFDYIAGYDSGYGAKPDKGMCVGFLKASGLEAHEVAMIGDSQFDLMAGRDAGMVTIGVLTGTADEAELSEADIVLRDITEIPDWLEKRNH